jgi:hypothetical protein
VQRTPYVILDPLRQKPKLIEAASCHAARDTWRISHTSSKQQKGTAAAQRRRHQQHWQTPQHSARAANAHAT